MPALSQQVDLPPRYRVVRHIANGGMATVWAAEDSVLERLVAVKVLAPGYAVDEAARRRFTREARAAARVSDHANVVTIFDIGEHNGQAFIVMEYLPGGTLDDRIKAREPLPAPTVVKWLRQAASALDAAHAADIVHRDVKPGNLLLDENGRLAVGDFGIASLAGETAVTAAGQVLGTAAYLSPEQARGRMATPASDRYSLAVVAYELLCGRRPFAGDTAIAQARARVEGEPLTATGPCDAAADVLRWGLSREPDARPASAAGFVDALEDALGDAAEATRATTVMTPLEPRANGPEWSGRDRPRFARGAGAAAAAGAAGAATGAAGAEARGRGDAQPDERGGETAARRGGAAAGAAGGASAARSSAAADVPRAPREPVAGRAGLGGPPPEPVARRRNPHRRAFALAGLAAVCLAVGAGAALISDDGNNGGRDATAPRATASKSQGAPTGDKAGRAGAGTQTQTQAQQQPSTAAPAASSATPPSTATSSTPATDGRSAAQINNAGYAMLPGNPQGALPLLQKAVQMFRDQGDRKSIDYAYSLYNLGYALRLAGRPAEAIPYLQERLAISDYKRGIVEQELRTAQQAAGQAPAGPGDGGKPKGKGKHKKD